MCIYVHTTTHSGVFIYVPKLAVYHYNKYFEDNIFIEVYIPPPL